MQVSTFNNKKGEYVYRQMMTFENVEGGNRWRKECKKNELRK